MRFAFLKGWSQVLAGKISSCKSDEAQNRPTGEVSQTQALQPQRFFLHECFL
jgi:hypothetical protein